ncbi:MAG: alpha/beta hydrolase [Deltaproteobacteria bacterium]|nr:alpha/beta hydrolase [Deltaproteobacteria bacterium]
MPVRATAPVRWILGAAAATLLAGSGTISLQRRILYPRHLVRAQSDAGEGIPGLERWWLDVPRGRVEAWFLPGAGAGPDTPAPLVVFAHGNAEVIEEWTDEMAPYRAWGVSLLLPEYRGYGRSGGRPSQEGITEDLVAFLDRALARPDVDPDRVVFHGRSLGGGVACALAGVRPPEALVLESTFTSARERAWEMTRLPRSWIRDPWDSLSVVSAFQGPVLVLHGTLDRTIPHVHGERLSEAAASGRLESWPAGHNDLPRGDRYWAAVRDTLVRAGVLAPLDPPASGTQESPPPPG